jgi:multidrug efflux pump subunit AcrA (membrane-fusion protein)
MLKPLCGTAVAAGLVTAGYLTRDAWLPWVTAGAPPSGQAAEMHGPVSAGHSESVRLTPQAQGNLQIVSKPLRVGTFWRTLQVPGTVVDRPAYSDLGVIAPVASVVTKVHAFPGDTVGPGDPLVTLRLFSETLHRTQAELLRATLELQINRELRARLAAASESGAIPDAKMVAVENEYRRLSAQVKSTRQELLTRGLTPGQIDGVAAGKFVSEVVVKAPQRRGPDSRLLAGRFVKHAVPPGDDGAGLAFEVQELKVELGQQVQAGQTLALLSNHQALYIEGRAFPQEAPLVGRAAKEGWPLEVECLEEAGGSWPPLDQPFTIRHIANTIDPATRTFAFFLPLRNQSRGFEKDGRALLLWRFRPGQKVRLHLKVEKLEDVFVLPADAAVREGPEAYVFRQNGDLFERKPVRVVYQDRRNVVLANDGGIPPGVFVAQSGATQLNRVLKGQGGLPGGFHVHADGTVHANH